MFLTVASATGGANNILNTNSCGISQASDQPSNTGNIRINGRFTLADNLLLTVDPSFQYVLANGGGSTAISESDFRVRGATPINPGPGIPGRDYNGDGDVLDTVRFFTPNNTNTHRYGLTASLSWDINDNHPLRVAYTSTGAGHRQTGEWGFPRRRRQSRSPFRGPTRLRCSSEWSSSPAARPLLGRLLNQVAFQYIGRFMEADCGSKSACARRFFKRQLETVCPIEAAGGGFAYCTSPADPGAGLPDPGSPGDRPDPDFRQCRRLHSGQLRSAGRFPAGLRTVRAEYNSGPIRPMFGIRYELFDGLSVFASFARGFSAPRTDNLTARRTVDVTLIHRRVRSRVRYRAEQRPRRRDGLDDQLFEPECDLVQSGARHLARPQCGKVDSWGVDASIGWDVIPDSACSAGLLHQCRAAG